MRLVFYLFIFSQLLNLVSVFANQYTKKSSELKPIKWEKIQENNSNNLKKIIWKSYKDDESYFQNINRLAEEKIHIKKATWRNRTLRFSFEEIDMPDAGEQMGLYSIGVYDQLNPWPVSYTHLTLPTIYSV